MKRATSYIHRVIQFARGLLGCARPSGGQDDFSADFFVKRGCEYYITARWAMRAQRAWVCGNLFHHAVESLLKADLFKNGTSLSDVERMRHDLRRLWRAYKANHSAADLEAHNKTINRLNKFEEIRYPNPRLHAIGVSFEWSGIPGEMKTFGGLRSPKQYVIVVSDIDDLVADVLNTSSWNPGLFTRGNPVSVEALTHLNNQAAYLTTVIP